VEHELSRKKRTCRALDGNAILLGGLRRVEGDLVIRLVAVLEAEVVVLDVNLEEGQDQLVLDLVPAG
jgi:hypothetical protein